MKNKFFVVVSIALIAASIFGLWIFKDSLREKTAFPSPFLAQVSPGANEALYFLSPSDGNFKVNNIFSVELRMGASENVTSIKAYVNFSSSLLSVTNIDIAGGAFQTYWEATSADSQVRIQASQPSPGVNGNDNLVATITFQAATVGTTNLAYDASSLALKADDTNILSIADSATGSYSITVPSGGSGASSGGVNQEPTATPAIPSTTTGNVTATASMGGNTTVTTSDKNTVKIDVPASAISVDTTFTIIPTAKAASNVTTQVAAVPSGQQIVGTNIYNCSATAAEASVTNFDSAVTIAFTYTDAQVAGLALSSLNVQKYDETTGTWTTLATTVNSALKTITAETNSFSYFAIFGSKEGGETPIETELPTPLTTEIDLVDINGNAIVDGDLITTDESFDIYIVKLKNNKKFKRPILNPQIFNSYDHLSWDNIRTVSQAVQDAYANSTLVIEVNPDGSVFNPNVYSVISETGADVGTKHWLNLTAAQFEASGYDWDSIYHINHVEALPDFYPLGSEITA